MNKKLFDQLKAKCKDMGISEKAIEEVATTLSDGLQDDAPDSDIEAKVNLAASFLKTTQSEATRWAQSAKQKAEQEAAQKAEAERKKANPQDPTPPAKTDPEIEEMKKRLEELEKQKANENFVSVIKSQLKEKNVPETIVNAMLTGRSFSSDEEVVSFVTATETAHKEYVQDLTEKGLTGANYNTFNAETAPKKAVESDIESWAEKSNPKK